MMSMCDKVKVSIIILISNGERFLAKCLDSVLNQSMREIEIICIDDASKDRSVDIVKEYAKKDCRIRPIFREMKKGILQGRKDGVLLSCGEYVLFVDADSLLEYQACEELYCEMKADPVDILHFRTEILGQSDINWTELESIKMPPESYLERIEGNSVFEKCFGENIHSSNLEDKLYGGSICRRALSHIEEGIVSDVQDKYVFFMIAYFAQSYRRIDREYYTYQYTEKRIESYALNPSMFHRYCAMGQIADAMERFIADEGFAADVFKNYRKQLLDEVLVNWMRVRDRQRAVAFDLIVKYWRIDEVIGGIAERYWLDQSIIAHSVKDAYAIKGCPRNDEIRTIGAYYTRLYGGGAERVTAVLANIWKSMGYQVVLFTDYEESAKDYYLTPGIERVVLPSYQLMKKENYGERAKVLKAAIREHNIDVVVYHSWVSTILLWDMLVCKLSGAAFVVHCHNVFPVQVRNFRTYFAWQTKNYQLCDAVLTLSDTDRLFWRNFNSNVHEVRNPLFFDPAEINRSSLQGNNIVWIGRFSSEKHPEDVLEIVKKVVMTKPEIKLYMLGEISEAQRKSYDEMVSKMGLEDNIEITGYLTDISLYMQQSSLLLMTSEFEGSPLALLEGMAYGLPCVMYELPYLAVVQDNKSIVSVKYKDTTAAATEIVEILCNANKRMKMGHYAYEYIKKYAEYSIENQWRIIFESLKQTHSALDEQNLLMFNTLIDFYEVGAERASKRMQEDGIKSALRAVLTRKTAFWGAGRRVQRLLNEYPGLNIVFCIDNDSGKAGGNINDVPIVHASNIDNWKELFIIVAVAANAEIVAQIESYGLRYGVDYVFATDFLT